MRVLFQLAGAVIAVAVCTTAIANVSIAQEASHSSEAAHGDDSHDSDSHGEADSHGAEGGHGDAHHDPTDLSHQNAGPQLEDPSEFKSDLAIWTFVLFLCLLAVLAKFAWGPIVAGLEKREQGIAAKIEEAQRSADQAARQLQQYEAKLAAAADEAREIVNQARKDAEAAKDRIVAEAQQVAERERQRAVEDIEAAKNVAVQDITERSVDLAVAMAGQLIRREIQAQDRDQLVKDALAQISRTN